MDEPSLFNRLRMLDDTWRVSFAEAGIICKRVEQSLLWKERCGSWTEWVHTACPFGSATAFEAYRCVKDLSDIPDIDLMLIPKNNLETLRQLSTAVRAKPDVIQAAKRCTAGEFVGMLNHD